MFVYLLAFIGEIKIKNGIQFNSYRYDGRDEVTELIHKFLCESKIDQPTFCNIGTAMPEFLEEFKKLDREMSNSTPSKIFKNMSTNRRGFYIYILCKELLSNIPSFNEFLDNIVYAGKGCKDRCFDHLRNAKNEVNEILNKDNLTEKDQAILDSWRNGMGIHVFRGFECSTNEESLNREASIIECIGLDKLTNRNRGTFSGSITGWSKTKIHNYGMFILYVLYLGNVYRNLEPVMYKDIGHKKA